jgi:hypothetical protein
MANDLVAQLGARLDQFATDLNQAGDMADSAVSRIEASFSNLNPSFGGLASLGGIAAGAIAGVAGLLAELKNVNAELAQIGQAAQYLNTTTDQVQKFQFAGTTQGISSEESLANLQNVGRLLNDANVNENSLTRLLDENGIQYKNQAGQLISINQLLSIGADLVKNAGTNADKTTIAQMLGLTQQWVPALEQGAAGFNKIAESAQAAGGIIDSATIAKAQNFDAAWKQSSALLAVQFKSVMGDVAGYLDDLIAKAQSFVEELNKANGSSPGSGQTKFNAIADMMQVASNDAAGLAQNLDQVNRVLDYLNQKGADPQIIAGIEAVREKAQAAADALMAAGQAESKLAFPGGVPLPGSRPAAANAPNPDPTTIPKRKTDDSEDAFTRAENQIIKRTEDYKAQTATIGENTQAKVQAKAIADLQTAADRAGLTLTDQQKQKMLDLAAAEGVAAQAAADRNQKLQQQNELMAAIGDQSISVLDGIRTGSLTAAQAVTQLTNYLITAIEKAALLGTGPLAGFFGTAASAGSGTTGGAIGSIASMLGFNGGSGVGSYGQASNATGLGAGTGGMSFPMFAAGTDSAPGGMSLVGENGPEIMNVPKGAQIIPNDVLRKGGGGDITVNLIEDSSRAGQTQQSSNSGGGIDLAVFVDSITAKNAANPGSATSAALNSRGRVTMR